LLQIIEASLDNQLVFGLTLNSPQKKPDSSAETTVSTHTIQPAINVQKNHLFKAILDSKSTSKISESTIKNSSKPLTATVSTSEKMEVDEQSAPSGSGVDQQSNVKRKLNQVRSLIIFITVHPL
jgi:hypothetical protein